MRTGRAAGPLLLLASVLLLVPIAELALRAVGRGPWHEVEFGLERDRRMHEPDARLGWRNRPGQYTVRLRQEGAEPLPMSFDEDGTRPTGAALRPGREILLLGCSYTAGWGLRDEETFGWRLQQRLPSRRVVNLGVSGYGGVQALLRLEDALAQRDDPPELVVYGYMSGHDVRNVGTSAWLELMAAANPSEAARLPYATLDASGALVRHAPEAFVPWPLAERSALVSWTQRLLSRWQTRDRDRQRRAVTEAIVREMDRAARDAGSRFLLLLLEVFPSKDRGHWAEFARQHGIRVADCMHPLAFSPEFRLPVDDHPNARANDFWAECVAKAASPKGAQRAAGERSS